MSWREFSRIYRPLLYRYARARGLDRESAEEVAQQCMALLAEKMPAFEYARSKGGFKAWLRRLANNRITDLFRKKKLPRAQTADLRRAQHRELSPEELWEREWERRHLKYCLELIRDEVAPTTYQAFEYHVLAEWPVKKVMEALDVSADQVYAAKSRITRRLRKTMRELLGDEA
jgi:RNA polymerase sigma-70 factor (ECF subfamily)